MNSTRSMPIAVLLAWLVPGLGHWWMGQKQRAVILFIVITVTFWGGVALGGVRSSITPKDNGLWIAAQLCAGPQTLGALALSNRLATKPVSEQYKAPWPASDLGVVYAGVAGLLNLLVILDVIARTDGAKAAAISRGPPRRGAD